MDDPFYTMWAKNEITEIISRSRILLNWEIELVVREVERFPTEENVEQLFYLSNIYVKRRCRRYPHVSWSDTDYQSWECNQSGTENSESQPRDGIAQSLAKDLLWPDARQRQRYTDVQEC
jgi:hypothetical protein